MAQGLYDDEPVFRAEIDRCAAALIPLIGLDVRDLLFGEGARREGASTKLRQTAFTQPALFAIEYALAQLWMARGVVPAAMIGHSVGEYVAACVAGVMSLDDALRLVATRGQLMQGAAPGVMIALPYSETDARQLANGRADVAAVNGPVATVLSGSPEGIAAIERDLVSLGVTATRLQTSHAFHSALMEPVLEEFAKEVARVSLQAPALPFVSNVTGGWITANEATDPRYWVRHLRAPVRFTDGVTTLLELDRPLFLEVGPGRTLATLVKRQATARSAEPTIISSLPSHEHNDGDTRQMATATGELWAAGTSIDWRAVHGNRRLRRTPLPTYPFQRERYWRAAATRTAAPSAQMRGDDIGRWIYRSSWRRSSPPASHANAGRWLVFLDRLGIGGALVEKLRRHGADVTTVEVGSAYSEPGAGRYVVAPSSRTDHERLLQSLIAADRTPARVAHLWSVSPDEEIGTDDQRSRQERVDRGFSSVVHLVAALQNTGVTEPVGLAVITSHTADVTGLEQLCPETSLVLGPCRTVAGEYSNIVARTIDVPGIPADDTLTDALTDDLLGAWSEPTTAFRGRYRWTHIFEPFATGIPAGVPSKLRPGGVYLITGGLGRIGLALADYLARTTQGKLVLVGRNGLPDRAEWSRWIASRPGDDAIANRMARIEAIESTGAEVLIRQADAADPAQMAAVLRETEQRFGTVHGVLHAAGDHAGVARIADVRENDVQSTFRAKLDGLRVLAAVLGDRPLDFCVVNSSVASFMGRREYAAYTAASVFMDTFVQRHNRTARYPWLTVNWDGWNFESDSGAAGHAQFGLAPSEATAVLARLLDQSGTAQAIVATGDPERRISRWVRLQPAAEPQPATAPAHTRPHLSSAYAAPESDLQRTLAAIWSELFGIERVGIHDNFFELGGDSVLNLQLSARAGQAGLKVPPKLLFEHQTIAAMAQALSVPVEAGALAAESPAAATPSAVGASVSAADIDEIWRQLADEDQNPR
jgi:acyl transferase domain-containing protein